VQLIANQDGRLRMVAKVANSKGPSDRPFNATAKQMLRGPCAHNTPSHSDLASPTATTSGSGRDVDQVLSSLEEHGLQLDGELRQIQNDIDLNKVRASSLSHSKMLAPLKNSNMKVFEKKYGDFFQPGIFHLQKLKRSRWPLAAHHRHERCS
jgi:hypothetical protein